MCTDIIFLIEILNVDFIGVVIKRLWLKVQNKIHGMRHSVYAKIDPPPRHPLS